MGESGTLNPLYIVYTILRVLWSTSFSRVFAGCFWVFRVEGDEARVREAGESVWGCRVFRLASTGLRASALQGFRIEGLVHSGLRGFVPFCYCNAFLLSHVWGESLDPKPQTLN